MEICLFFQRNLWSANILAIKYSFIKRLIIFLNQFIYGFIKVLKMKLVKNVNHSFVKDICIQVLFDKHNINF